MREEPEIKYGIGLNRGRVMYGNVGTPERIKFSVIGNAANEAARIESQCKELDETILVSGVFERTLPIRWCSHGEFNLRNIGHPIEVLSPEGGGWFACRPNVQTQKPQLYPELSVLYYNNRRTEHGAFLLWSLTSNIQ